MTGWPFAGDSPVVIARKVAGAYRDALGEVSADAMAAVDARMLNLGQTWVLPRVLRFDLDDWLGVRDAADLAQVEPDTIGAARRRGRLSGRKVDGRWEYRARDVLALSANPRTRRRTVE